MSKRVWWWSVLVAVAVGCGSGGSGGDGPGSGAWQALLEYPQFDGLIHDVGVYDGELILAGQFTIDGTIEGIARFDGSTWSGLGTGLGGLVPGAPPSVSSVGVYDGSLYASGEFETAGGTYTQTLARWDGANWFVVGNWNDVPDNVFPGVALSMLPQAGGILMGGTFCQRSSCGGSDNVGVSGVALWDGGAFAQLGDTTNPYLVSARSLAEYSGQIYAGTDSGNEALLRFNGTTWELVGGGIPETFPSVNALAVFDGELYAAGQFSMAGTISADNIVRWDGSAYSVVGDGLPGFGGTVAVTDLEVLAGALYAGGSFSELDGAAADDLAAWDGTSWSAVGAGPTGPVTALTTWNGNLIVAGGGWGVSSYTP